MSDQSIGDRAGLLPVPTVYSLDPMTSWAVTALSSHHEIWAPLSPLPIQLKPQAKLQKDAEGDVPQLSAL